MKTFIKKHLKSLFSWIFEEELKKIKIEQELNYHNAIKVRDMISNYTAQEKRIVNLLDNIDVSVDHHIHSSSWAVISIQGEKSDYIKFVDLGRADIDRIAHFVSQFERIKVDASPEHSKYIKMRAR